MLSHYLVTLYRALTRHRLYAALNVLGLAVGIAVFLVLWLDVRFETGFERWIPDVRNLYVVHAKVGGMFADLAAMPVPPIVLEDLEHEDPHLRGTRVADFGIKIASHGKMIPEDLDAVDANLFQIIDLPFEVGNKNTALDRPDNLLLTESKARQYFGSTDIIGRVVSLAVVANYGRNTTLTSYRVAGVLKDLPSNTDLKFDFITPLSTRLTAANPRWRSWGQFSTQTYLRLHGAAEARALDARFDSFVDRHDKEGDFFSSKTPAHDQLRLRLMALTAQHLSDPKDAAVVAALGGMGVLALLIAGLNYVNLATARSASRATEVAIRKVMGATRRALVIQFMIEALAVALLAALLGLSLCELAVPAVNAAAGLTLSIRYGSDDHLLLVVIATAVGIGLAAGVYPAIVLAQFRPALVLASVRSPGGGRVAARIREVLVTLQFAGAIGLTVVTVVIAAQTSYLRRGELGFQREGLLIVPAFGDADLTAGQRASLLDAWRALPGVSQVTAAALAPGVDAEAVGRVSRPGEPGYPSISFVFAKPGFFSGYGVHLLAGRLPDLAHGADMASWASSWGQFDAPASTAPVAQNVVLNATAARALGFARPADAIGVGLRAGVLRSASATLTVIGVVSDIRFQSPRTKIPPTIYTVQSGDFGAQVAAVRVAGVAPKVVLQRMRTAWEAIAPQVVFDGQTADSSFGRYYRKDEENGRLFLLGAGLAVFLACLGLYGMAAFSAERRTREIGIRKTLGASTADILRLLVGQFLKPVLIANLIAWPLAWLAMRDWLSGFDQRIALGPQYFLFATTLTLAVALLTVAGQAWLVARAEPARALRHE